MSAYTTLAFHLSSELPLDLKAFISAIRVPEDLWDAYAARGEGPPSQLYDDLQGEGREGKGGRRCRTRLHSFWDVYAVVCASCWEALRSAVSPCAPPLVYISVSRP